MIGLLLLAACSTHEPPVAYDPTEPGEQQRGRRPTVLWSAPIGLTTYRSTIHVQDGQVIVNSNGADWSHVDDPKDGLYWLDAATGAVLRQVRPEKLDQRDVNGAAIAPWGVAFGTDGGEVHAVGLDGSPRWIVDVGGDVEMAVVVAPLVGDAALDVIAGTETADGAGALYVIDGTTGQPRLLFNAPAAFVATPAVRDVNGDGVPEIFVGARDWTMRAFDGASGELLWERALDSGVHGAPIFVGDSLVFTEAYSRVHAVNPLDGEGIWGVELNHPGGGLEGLFGPIGWYPTAGCVVVGTAWWEQNEGVYCLSGRRGIHWRLNEPAANITSGFVVGDVGGDETPELVFGTESGRVYAVDPWGRAVWTWQAAGPIEASPTLADLDGDGRTEVLVASNDGVLQALRTEGQASPVIPYYRGSPTNDGVLAR